MRLKWSEEDNGLLHQFEYRVREELTKMKADPEYFFNYFYEVEGRKVATGGVEFFDVCRRMLKRLSKGSFKIKG